MAASHLGLGHETYTYYPPAASVCFPADLVVANNCAATMNFLPPAAAMAADDYFPELGRVHPPDYYSPPPQVFASKNEMNIAAGGNGRPPSSRIGFRTRSEVDVLDDGFKWRKYGKKAVKSNPSPRNYYRCSVEGCGVKKRVERDRHDPRYVVTTYDGVHNHAAHGCAAAPPQQAAATLAAAPTPDVWGTMQLHELLF